MPDPRPPARTFRDLLVWQKAHRFVLALYAFTAEFPKQETYGLRSQMRRAAVSIPANIAEGFAKRSKPDKARYMNIAEGSVEESRYYLILLAADLGYGQTDELLAELEQVSRLLNSYALYSGSWLLTLAPAHLTLVAAGLLCGAGGSPG
jgi:four helix bundle protein